MGVEFKEYIKYPPENKLQAQDKLYDLEDQINSVKARLVGHVCMTPTPQYDCEINEIDFVDYAEMRISEIMSELNDLYVEKHKIYILLENMEHFPEDLDWEEE